VAEQAQELSVTNTGQPLTVDLVATSAPVEVAQELNVLIAANVEVNIDPASE